jgi:hypothetical protein
VFWAPFNRSATRMRRRVIFTRRSPRSPSETAGAAAVAGAGEGLAAAGAAAGGGDTLGVGEGLAGAAGSAACCMRHSWSIS